MSHFLSVFTNAYGPFGVRAAVDLVRAAGLDAVELALRGHNFGGLVIPESVVVTEKATDVEAQSFKDHLVANRVRVSGCNVGGADLLTIEGRDLTGRRIRFSKTWFNAKVVVSGAGQPRDANERAIALRHLGHLGDIAAGLDIVIALETHKGPTQNAASMLTLMRELDHPHVRLNFDTGNIAYYNDGADPVHELEQVAHLVSNVHLKDNRGRFEDWFFPAPGDGGAVNFVKIREILDGFGYDGAYTIEIEGIGGEPEPGLEARQLRVARGVNHLCACGYLAAPSDSR